MLGLVNEHATSQSTDITVAMATQICEVGASFRPVEPNMYEVTPENGEATLMSAHQFHTTLSLVSSLKSFSTIPVY